MQYHSWMLIGILVESQLKGRQTAGACLIKAKDAARSHHLRADGEWSCCVFSAGRIQVDVGGLDPRAKSILMMVEQMSVKGMTSPQSEFQLRVGGLYDWPPRPLQGCLPSVGRLRLQGSGSRRAEGRVLPSVQRWESNKDETSNSQLCVDGWQWIFIDSNGCW